MHLSFYPLEVLNGRYMEGIKRQKQKNKPPSAMERSVLSLNLSYFFLSPQLWHQAAKRPITDTGYPIGSPKHTLGILALPPLLDLLWDISLISLSLRSLMFKTRILLHISRDCSEFRNDVGKKYQILEFSKNSFPTFPFLNDTYSFLENKFIVEKVFKVTHNLPILNKWL